jgi:hypothetical protein
MTAYPPYPEDYVIIPVSVLRADKCDGLIVTMSRIMALCWGYRYRRSPPYTRDQLLELLDRSASTYHRHIRQLRALGWLTVEHEDQRIILKPAVTATRAQASSGGCSKTEAGGKPALGQALREAGIRGSAYYELLHKGLDPAVVRAWILWSWAPQQDWMDNRAGYIITRLREGSQPPTDFLELARLTPEETALLERAWVRSEHTMGWPSLEGNDKLLRLAPLWVKITEAMRQRQT